MTKKVIGENLFKFPPSRSFHKRFEELR